MMQKLFLVQTLFTSKDAFRLYKWLDMEESQNMLVKKTNLRVLGISLKTESRVPRLCWNINLQSFKGNLKTKSSICY